MDAIDPLSSRRTVEWDWIVTAKSYGVLHCPIKWDDPEYEAHDERAVTACGLRGWFVIPGVFSRMGKQRCKKCCKKVGFPPGKGSPKNDDSCRPLVEERLRTLGIPEPPPPLVHYLLNNDPEADEPEIACDTPVGSFMMSSTVQSEVTCRLCNDIDIAEYRDSAL